MPLPKKRIIPEKKVYFHPEILHCPDCGIKLKRHHTAWKKNISTLQGVIQVWNMAYFCPSEACGPLRRYFRSAQADALCMRHTSYGFDVLALVGELRFKQRRPLERLLKR